jgi:hypothetical protein
VGEISVAQNSLEMLKSRNDSVCHVRLETNINVRGYHNHREKGTRTVICIKLRSIVLNCCLAPGTHWVPFSGHRPVDLT